MAIVDLQALVVVEAVVAGVVATPDQDLGHADVGQGAGAVLGAAAGVVPGAAADAAQEAAVDVQRAVATENPEVAARGLVAEVENNHDNLKLAQFTYISFENINPVIFGHFVFTKLIRLLQLLHLLKTKQFFPRYK